MKKKIIIGEKYWFKNHGIGEIAGFTTRGGRKSCNVKFSNKNTIFSEKYIKEKCNLHCGVEPDPEISKDEKKELHTLYELLNKVQTIEEYKLIVDGITKIRIHEKFVRCLNKKGSKIEEINPNNLFKM